MLRLYFLLGFVWMVLSSLPTVCLAQTTLRYTLTDSVRSSAGVYKQDGTLLRTLWSGVLTGPGTYTHIWDGTDDDGRLLPDGDYVAKVLSNNVTYTWEGVIGNTSQAKTGPTYLSALESIACMAVSGGTAYYGVHYNEQKGSCFKLSTANPRAKTDVLGKGAMVWLVATDGTNVYWGGADPNQPTKSFAFATSIATDADVSFTAGARLQTSYGRAYPGALSVMDQADATLTGLAVQQSGRFLLLSRQRMNTIYVLDKKTGVLVQTVAATAPREIAIDKQDNIWLISGTRTVQHYSLQPDGTLRPDGTPLTGLVDPLNVSVSPDGTTLVVCDGGASQQLKAYDTRTGAAIWTFGQAGGYATDPTVATDKFYFTDSRSSRYPITPADTKYASPFVAFEPDGSFWVNDLGNNRVLHYTASRTYLNQIMAMTGSASCSVNPTNPSQVFCGFLEFRVDYTKPLDPTNGSWTLVKNWGGAITAAYDANFYVGQFRFVVTLSNGRTYSVLTTNQDNVLTYELVELPANGPLRFTGIRFPNYNYQLYPDGSLRVQSLAQIGKPITWQKQVLVGFDNQQNPRWGPLQPVAQSSPLTTADPGYWGNPVSLTSGEITASDVVVAFDGGRSPSGPDTWYHLGGVRVGSDKWLWRTAPSSHTAYTGDYPTDGTFDIGNGVNNAGSRAIVTGRHIFWGYYGEFWKGTQTNKWQHVYDNGLFVGQFGKTGRDSKLFELFAEMTGNAFSAYVVPSPIDPNVAYLYHNDDGWHCGVHRWRISGLNTIQEQAIPLSVRTPLRGLRAEYFDGRELDNTGLATVRVEAGTAINWPGGPANTNLPDRANYSTRWQGFVQPVTTGPHTFYVNTNGPTRLWIDEKLVIDQWTNTNEQEFTSQPVTLNTDRRFALRVEYAPTGAAARLDLRWSAAGVGRQSIPSAQLTPAPTIPADEGTNLLAYLPAAAVLEPNLYGWHRTPASDSYADPSGQFWTARTGFKSYGRDRLTSSDLWVKHLQHSGTYTVSRTLSKQADTTRWRLSGAVYYDDEDGNKPNQSAGYVDVVDDRDRVIVRLYVANMFPTMALYANKVQLAQLPKNDMIDILYRVQPLDIQMSDRTLTIKYGPFAAVTTTPLDSTANWKRPRALRLLFQGNNDGAGHAFGIERLRFLAPLPNPNPSGSNLRLEVYPNPSPDQVVVTFPVATETGHLDVLSTSGQQLLRLLIPAGSSQAMLNLQEFSHAVYILKYTNGSIMLSKRFLKQ